MKVTGTIAIPVMLCILAFGQGNLWRPGVRSECGGGIPSVERKWERAVRRYCRAVGRRLYCSRDIKREFLRDFRERIDCFQTEENVSDLQEIYKRFGTAKEAARAFQSTLPMSEVKWAKIRIWAGRIVLYTALLAFLIYFIEELVDQHSALNGYYVIELWEYGTVYAGESVPIP